jgi:hypothetical protein
VYVKQKPARWLVGRGTRLFNWQNY